VITAHLHHGARGAEVPARQREIDEHARIAGVVLERLPEHGRAAQFLVGVVVARPHRNRDAIWYDRVDLHRAVGADIAIRESARRRDETLLLERGLSTDEIGDGDATLRLCRKERFPSGKRPFFRHRLEAALEVVAALAFEVAALRDLVERGLAEDADDLLRVLVPVGEMWILIQNLADASQHHPRVGIGAVRLRSIHRHS